MKSHRGAIDTAFSRYFKNPKKIAFLWNTPFWYDFFLHRYRSYEAIIQLNILEFDFNKIQNLNFLTFKP